MEFFLVVSRYSWAYFDIGKIKIKPPILEKERGVLKKGKRHL